MRKFRRFLDSRVVMLATALLLYFAVAAIAQGPPEPNPPPNFSQLAVQVITAVGALLTSVFTWVGRSLVTKTPRVVIPFVAEAIGAGVAYLLEAVIPGLPPGSIPAATVGVLAVFLREIGNTFNEHGFRA